MKPLIVDNSSISSFRVCPTKYHYRHEENLTTPRVPAALNFGAAVHAGIAAWLRGVDKDKAVAMALQALRPQELPTVGKEEWRTPTHLVELLDVVFAQDKPEVMLGKDGQPVVEAEGLYPLCNPDDYPKDLSDALRANGYDSLAYAFILDAVSVLFDTIYVTDHKTTTNVRGAKGEPAYIDPSFSGSFAVNAQMMGYVWGLQKLIGKKCGGILINAIGIHSYRILSPSFTAKDYFCFQRFTVNYTPEQLEEWRLSTIEAVKSMLRMRLSGKYQMTTESCYLYKKPCPYLPLCSIPPSERKELADKLYIREVWDPLEARKKEVAKAESE